MNINLQHYLLVFLLLVFTAFNIELKEAPIENHSAYSSYPISNVSSEAKNYLEKAAKQAALPVSSSATEVLSHTPSAKSENAPALTAAFHYHLGSAYIAGQTGSLENEKPLSINGLHASQTPPLDLGMVNVTGHYSGYRMLPKGTVFTENIDVVLPYDSTLLPPGFTTDDIVTYYYNEEYSRWIAIKKDSVDASQQLVHSKVNHFTDFINAVMKTPEMPETSAYTPTSIKELKAANPMEGLQMMSPPSANNSGSANMSYPLEIPAGRQGMQPQLALSYSSDGGNGWLGQGWDISIPAITVETRWGVPRYDAVQESEVYLFQGQQLVTKDSDGNHEPMPHRTNVWRERSQGETQFYPRVEEAFDSIVRHGDNPSNYWWSVTDRNGITHYYGKQHGVNAFDTSSVLRGAQGIAHWALTESVDLYGNTVRYYYDVVKSNGELQGASKGVAIYVDSINYTGFEEDRGIYSVTFNRGTQLKEDITVQGKYGFKEVQDQLLCHININYNDTIMRMYTFTMENERHSYYKTRLTDFYVFDSCINQLTPYCGVPYPYDLEDKPGYRGVHTKLEYYDALDENNTFGDTHLLTFTPNTFSSIFNANVWKPTALGGTRDKSWSIGGNVGAGLGANVAMCNIGAGGNFDHNRSKAEGMLTLVDLDGDGLSDRLYKSNNVVYFAKRIQINEEKFHYATPIPISTLSNFLRQESKTNTWGLQASIGHELSGGWPKTTSFTDIYFSDVNADGLPDLITDKGVMFNNPIGDIPYFELFPVTSQEDATGTEEAENNDIIEISSVDTCNYIIFDGEVNDSIGCYYITEFYENISIYTFDDNSMYYDTSDIFTYEIKENKTVDIYIKKLICEPASNDPDLDLVRVWVAPSQGKISINSDFQLLEDTSDIREQSRFANGVRYAIERVGKVNAENNYTLSSNDANLLYSQDVFKDDYKKYDYNIINDLEVEAGDLIFFRLQSKGNRDFDKVDWNQQILYTYLAGANIDNYGKDRRFYDAEDDFIVTGDEYFQAPVDGDAELMLRITVPSPQQAKLLVYHNDVVDSIDLNQQLFDAEYSYSISNMNQGENIMLFVAPSDYALPVQWDQIKISPIIDFTGAYRTDSSSNETTTYTLPFFPSVKMLIPNMPELTNTKRDTIYRALFGSLYRGWGQFLYNNNEEEDTDAPIVVEKLKRELMFFQSAATSEDTIAYSADSIPISIDDDMSAGFDELNLFNPLSTSTKWVALYPDNYRHTWKGYGNINFLGKNFMINTRVPELMFDLQNDPLAGNSNTDDMEMPETTGFDSPIPMPTTTTEKVKTIRKMVETEKNRNFSISSFVPPIIIFPTIGSSESKGANRVLTDYMDLNGDRFPDIIGDANVQYTNPWGGIGDMVQLFNLSGVARSTVRSYGETYGGCYNETERTPKNSPSDSKIKVGCGASLGVGNGSSSDKTNYAWGDVNGDGLPDKIRTDNNTVALNMGYYFLAPETWSQGTDRAGAGKNTSVSIGASYGVSSEKKANNLAQGSISAGISGTRGENWTTQQLLDFNGDGLLDKVAKSGSSVKVAYNLGNGSWSEEDVFAIPEINKGTSFSIAGNIGVTGGYTWGWFKLNVGVNSTPSVHNVNKEKAQLIDINGDGYVDYVTSNSMDTMKVRYNQAGKTNLLKKVTHFTGASMELFYDMPLSCYEQPHRNWNLDSLVISAQTPAQGDTIITTFQYKNPFYHRMERMNFGYDTVITKQYDTQNNNALYRYTIEGYHNDNLLKKGEKTSTTILDGNHNPYIETLYEMVLIDFEGNVVENVGCDISNVFPAYEAEITNYYEGHDTAYITTAKSFQYDGKRNVIQYINWGDTVINNDDIMTNITYLQNMPNNLIALPKSMHVYKPSAQNQVMRKKTSTYNNQGRSTQIRQYGTNDEMAAIDLEYDNYGNVTKITYPPNDSLERMSYQYIYDTVAHTYPIRTKDTLGYYSSTQYDYRFGKPIKTVDINNQVMRYQYDSKGRLISIMAPNETANNNSDNTIEIYYNTGLYGEAVNHGTEPMGISSASTTHRITDTNSVTQVIKTVTYCDALGRIIQTQKDAEVNGVKKMIVSGKVIYDPFGRITTQYYPTVKTWEGNSILSIHYIDTFDNNTATTTTYDILDRQTTVTLPNNTTTNIDYDFGNDAFDKLRFKTTTTDPLGNVMTTFSDYRQLQTTITAPDTTSTTFQYNPLGELLQTTDPNNISTYYAYDQFGQQTTRTHPDAGEEKFIYDLAGNLTQRMTANLLEENKKIEYHYHFNQLRKVIYPNHPANNVTYTYGQMGDIYNRAGRIKMQEDASGYQVFSYGRLGEIIENSRTMILPNEEEPYTFSMKFSYDSWNRIKDITYPDQEIVTYYYNHGGMLEKIKGRKGEEEFDYIDSINYNQFEKKSEVFYGNGTETYYEYDTLQRLSHLTSYTAQGEAMQNITYTYDAVNNITQIRNNATTLQNNLGNQYKHTYTYDKLYRLKNATGKWGTAQLNYDLNMQYTPNGRIENKQLSADILNETEFITQTNYNHQYVYNNSQPNTLQHIAGDNSSDYQEFQWDKNGNMTLQYNPNQYGERHLCWDEENRLQGVSDNMFTSYYQYDAAGERSYKLTGYNYNQQINGQQQSLTQLSSPTLYTSPYLVATPQGYTKHYYAEAERIASKIGGGGLQYIDDKAVYYKRGIETNPETPYPGGGIIGFSLPSILPPTPPAIRAISWDSIVAKQEESASQFELVMDCLNQSPYIANNLLTILYDLEEIDAPETQLYYYHPDHLGSSSWITNTNGQATQHLAYLPFGESFVSQRMAGAPTRYTFSAKEKDLETGYSYFGARYYSSDLSIWLSVDPLADAHPDYTHYAYVYNNPIKLKDPYGLDSIFYDSKGSIINTIKCDRNYYFLKHNEGNIQYKGKSYYQGISPESFFGDKSDQTGSVSVFKKVDQFKLSTLWKVAHIVNNYTQKNPSVTQFLWQSRNLGDYDYKNEYLKKRNGNERTVFLINGYLFNINEAGNLLWGATAAKLGINEVVARLGGEVFTLFSERTFDEPAEQFSISWGYDAWKMYGNNLKK